MLITKVYELTKRLQLIHSLGLWGMWDFVIKLTFLAISHYLA